MNLGWFERTLVRIAIWKMVSNRNVGNALALLGIMLGMIVACAAVAASIVTWAGR